MRNYFTFTVLLVLALIGAGSAVTVVKKHIAS